MFAKDRDLLIVDANLFRDVAWTGQRLVSGTGSISGTTLSLSAHDVTLEAAAITAGHVALVDAIPCEIVERLSPTTATVSRIRPGPDQPVIPPAPATGKPVSIHTFAPQIAATHQHLLKLLGIGAEIAESQITNADSLREVEALGALYHVYCIAAGPGGLGGSVAATWLDRARLWRDRYAAALGAAAAMIDLDGDGRPDATRRPGFIHLMRE